MPRWPENNWPRPPSSRESNATPKFTICRPSPEKKERVAPVPKASDWHRRKKWRHGCRIGSESKSANVAKCAPDWFIPKSSCGPAGLVFWVTLYVFVPVSDVDAGLIEISITAKVEYVDDLLDNILNGQIAIDDIITGKYIYESSTSDSYPLNPSIGEYWHYNSPCGISLIAGGFFFQTDPDNVKFLVEIINDLNNNDNYLL